MRKGLGAGPNLPVMFQNVLYRHYDIERGDAAVLRQLKAWRPSASRPFALLHGKPGLGKTMLACATLNETQRRSVEQRKDLDLHTRRWLRQHKFPVYYVQLAELIEMHIRLFRLQGGCERGSLSDPTEYWNLDQLLEDLKYTVKLLVVDDVGKEHRTATGFAEDQLDFLVRTRLNRGLPTIYTSNVPLYQWGSQYSESMRSCIERSSLVLEFNRD